MARFDRLKTFATSFAVNIASEYITNEGALDAMQAWLIGRIKLYTPGHVAWAIQNDYMLWGNLPPRLKVALEKFAKKDSTKKQYNRFSGLVTAELIMKWLKEGRPDVFSIIINDPEGMKWIGRNADELKKAFEKILIR